MFSSIARRQGTGFFSVALLLAFTGVTAPRASAAIYSVLYAFGGPDGANPQAPVLIDSAGNVYGTTTFGGLNQCCLGSCPPPTNSPCGVVFKIDPTGKESVLHAFTGYPVDGSNPYSALILDDGGNLYGTTSAGGPPGICAPNGCGTVFKVTSSGQETMLYGFKGGANGSSPGTGLLRDAAGNLFGTTQYGGLTSCIFGCGTVFKLDAAGTHSILYHFTGGADGGQPRAGLIWNAGNFFGTTLAGGFAAAAPCYNTGCGVVFKMSTAGKETVLHMFTGVDDGSDPANRLIIDSAGTLYGADDSGGLGGGVVFELRPGGEFITLDLFGLQASDIGAQPNSLIRDSKGNLYGTTTYGGASSCGCGLVFKLSPAGEETVLYTFQGGEDGAYPYAGLAADAAGNLYGTTLYGGNTGGACGISGCGVVFKLKP
jgi:uncharacterized repeat protein (TIGR03803 family)